MRLSSLTVAAFAAVLGFGLAASGQDEQPKKPDPAPAAPATDAKPLVYKLVKGQKFKAALTWNVEQTEANKKTTRVYGFKLGLLLNYEVLVIERDGSVKLKGTVQSIESTVTEDKLTATFDTAKPGTKPDPLLKSLEKGVGKSFEFHIMPNGKVTELKGAESIRDPILEAAAAAEAARPKKETKGKEQILEGPDGVKIRIVISEGGFTEKDVTERFPYLVGSIISSGKLRATIETHMRVFPTTEPREVFHPISSEIIHANVSYEDKGAVPGGVQLVGTGAEVTISTDMTTAGGSQGTPLSGLKISKGTYEQTAVFSREKGVLVEDSVVEEIELAGHSEDVVTVKTQIRWENRDVKADTKPAKK